MNTVNAPSLALTFSGRAAVVTGAMGGIGAATADLLLAAGLRVIGLDRAPAKPNPTYGDRHACVQVDITDPRAIDECLDAIGVADDGLSYLVNCAGLLQESGFSGATPDVWAKTLGVNLVGAHVMIEALRQRLAPDGGAIVNVSSIEAERVIALSNPDPNPHYAASKAGLEALTRAAARSLAPLGVRVNSVAPGFVATAMAAGHGDTDSLPPGLASRVPAGRFAQPTEIAQVIAFLLSDQAGFVTGAGVRADGGFALT